MKSYYRILGLIIVVLLLTAILPASADVELSRSTDLLVAPPSSYVENEYETPHNLVVRTILPFAPPPLPATRQENDDIAQRRAVIAEAIRAQREKSPSETLDLYIQLPPDAAKRQPLNILLALHGMGSRGDVFAQNLIPDSDRSGWLVVSPMLNYDSNYMDPVKLLADDLRLTRLLKETLDGLPKKLGLKLNDRVFIYGFSRGGQLGHRFALFYPERVDTVVTLSAGTYTMPMEKRDSDKGPQPMLLPYGVADVKQLIGLPIDWVAFKKISFWIGVGDNDNHVEDVPRAFDAYAGRTRIERAQAFEKALLTLRMDAQLVIFRNAGHEVTPEMRVSAMQLLKEKLQAHTAKR